MNKERLIFVALIILSAMLARKLYGDVRAANAQERIAAALEARNKVL